MIPHLQFIKKFQIPRRSSWGLGLGIWGLGLSSFFFLPSSSSSQPLGNQWIIYAQKYLEFKIVDTGIYRIDYSTLSQGLNSIGESINSIDPHKIQIYGRGEQQYIYIEGESDSGFDNADFIEFYATQNDGWLDAQLYESPNDQSNPFYSLFNDTATYYLTISGNDGKRMGMINYSASGTEAQYFFKEEIISFKTNYYQGEYLLGAATPLYKAGKGWFSGFISQGVPLSAFVNASFAYNLNQTPATAMVVLTGANGNAHNLKISYGSSDTTVSFNSYQLKKYSFNIPFNDLTGNTLFKITSTSPANPPDYTALSHVYLKYAHNLNLSGNSKIMILLPSSPVDPTHITFTSYPSTQKAYIYDFTSNYRIETKDTLNTLRASIPKSDSERKCFLFPTSQIVNITSLIPVTSSGKFTDYSPQTDSAFIIITHPSLLDGANEYKVYRADFNQEAIVADIEELYDQFAYGINKHPLAIKNFSRSLLLDNSKIPAHLFIIGKAISEASFNTRNNTSLYSQNLVPTYGWPGSDAAFTSGLNGTAVEPAIPTGRLAAKSYSEVKNYLDKVKAFENNLIENQTTQMSIPNKIWMKHAIHFSGGDNEILGATLYNYLQVYENTLESDSFGGNVTRVAKNSTVPIQVNLSDSIVDMIEDGVSILTFFGHSSANYTDVSIGFASDYNFKPGRFPLMIVNGCGSGDIFTAGSSSTSEDFVLTGGKGAIGYIAEAGLGFPPDLHNYTNNLYNNISKKSYGKSIGKCMKQGMADYQPADFLPVATALGMVLHGDPSVKINTHKLPDYAISPAYVFFNPADVTTADDSFEMNIIIANLGMTDPDSVSVLIRRTLPNGNVVSYNRIIPPVFYKETLTVILPVDLVNGAGLNQFYIHVDENFAIEEISDQNNFIGENEITLMIKSGDLIPVYPYNYAVVPNKNIVLKASTSDPFAAPKEYIFQVDTIDTYNSPKFQQFTIIASGGVVKWNIDSNYFNLPDSTAFFWRASPNTPPDYRWREHSFQVISGKTGWGQKHFFQYKNDDTTNINYNRQERQYKFSPQQKGLRCDVWGFPQSPTQYDQTQYLINNAQQDYNSATYSNPAMYIAIIDKCTLKPWGTKKLLNGVLYNPDHDFGNANNLAGPPGRWWTVEYYFVFRITIPAEMDSMRNLINNKIPDGNYVLAYSFGNGMFSDPTIWTPSHVLAFKNLGADNMNLVPDNVPYIFFGQKGNPGIAQDTIGSSWNSFISLNANMVGCTGNGDITTPVIGPGKKWSSLHWKFTANNFTGDTVKIDVLNAISGTVIKNYSSFSGDIIPFDTAVNATLFPYIKLRAAIKDDTFFTAVQPVNWYVLHDEIPEAALNSSRAFSFHASSLQQGDALKFNIAIENVSNAGMDSLRIKYWIVNSQQNMDTVLYKKNGPLAAGNVMFDTVSFPSKNLSGNCRFWMEVNPLDSQWQLEQYHFNNIASIGFSSEKDNMNPLLDVTFDGVRILNGDIVSPKPEIIIQLKDENKYLALDDTTKFKIFIIDPEKKSERIYFVENGKEQMRFNKAVLPDNKCKIEYAPVFINDGIYELRVQGTDASGNNAGDLDYSITFEVINKSTITEILNYPNPFSTSTRFVFTLTGSEIPDYFKIQILTVSGKVIREINRNEFGNMHIGRNITEYFWNGTDEYGDPLANGVYLYRVIVKINGEQVEHRETNADSFFKKGFGKMYLMR